MCCTLLLPGVRANASASPQVFWSSSHIQCSNQSGSFFIPFLGTAILSAVLLILILAICSCILCALCPQKGKRRMDKRETDPGVYPSQEDEESHISIGTHASSSHFVVEFEGSEYIYIHISFHGVLVICYMYIHGIMHKVAITSTCMTTLCPIIPTVKLFILTIHIIMCSTCSSTTGTTRFHAISNCTFYWTAPSTTY